ncbi:MAG: pilus assembly protein PilM [Dehalococcoidales bacterium]|nr:pilus assembly protein PilM [Dehalococcoidales bacterium]
MYVALNISNSNIQVLSLKGRQVKKWGNLVLNDGLVRDGLILQPQAVGEAIDSLFKSTKIPRENVIVSLAGLSFTYRFLSLPRMKPALLEEAILRAARKEISLPLDELYLSWHPLPGKGEEQEFFVLGVPRNLVDAMLQTLSSAGVEPYLMDLRPLALARTANRGDAIVVNLESDCFDIVFIANGIPKVIHTISPRSDGATLEDNIRRLADELSKTAAFYQSSHPESQPGPTTPLLLTGELSAEAPASGLLQAEVEYSVEPLAPPVEFPPELPVEAYTASIGLALKKTPQKSVAKGEETRFHDININILSGKYRKKKTEPIPAGYMLLGIFLTIAVVALFPLYHSRSQLTAENAELQTELSSISRQVNLASLIAEETTLKEDTIQEMLESAEALNIANRSVLGNRGDYTSNLQLITGALPPETYFTSIEIDDNRITARGETDSVFTVINYAQALEATNAFSEVRITVLDEDVSIASEAEEGETALEGVRVITFEILVDI